MIAWFMRSAAFAVMAGAMLAGSLALPVQAEEGRIAWSQLTKQLEDKGYNIREIERKRYGWKAKVMDRNGEQYELRFNRAGVIIREEYKD